MNALQVRTRIVEAFRTRARSIPGGQLRIPDAPVVLRDLFLAACADDDERDEIESEGLPIETVSERGVTVVTFEWQSIGPMSTLAGLSVIDVGTGEWLVRLDDEQWGTRLVAAIAPLSAATFSAFFTRFLERNGDAFDAPLFGSLPTSTEIHAPALLSRDALGEAYLAWQTWAHDAGWVEWGALEWSVERRLEQPDRARRAIEDASTVAEILRSGEAPWASADVPDAERRAALVEAYVGLAVRVSG